MHYSIINKGNRFYEAFSELKESIGTLEYGMWGVRKAEVASTTAEFKYHLSATGFWQTTIIVNKGDTPFAEIKPVLGRGLQLSFSGTTQTFMFKKKAAFSTDYKVVDENDRELATVEPHFKWKKFGYDYEIDVQYNTLDEEINLVLPLLLVYCVRYQRMRQSAAT